MQLETIKEIKKYEYTKAAIIGYWRMGAETYLISLITGLEQYQIEEIIKNYKSK